jgi:hypothetical protein
MLLEVFIPLPRCFGLAVSAVLQRMLEHFVRTPSTSLTPPALLFYQLYQCLHLSFPLALLLYRSLCQLQLCLLLVLAGMFVVEVALSVTCTAS